MYKFELTVNDNLTSPNDTKKIHVSQSPTSVRIRIDGSVVVAICDDGYFRLYDKTLQSAGFNLREIST